ncbi:3-methyladenine DNA glycosylase AlkD [Peptoniphilus olsenii]|uniref:3-methyladenine DNA glycosylase AlkD n=1 Tax=Peptoniphilus olsenii TaxID=411570 RepID=A0ABV2J6M5_9FIRM
MNIQDILFEFQDERYANFQSKLIPNIEREKVIGVRVPKLRQLAKDLSKNLDVSLFLQELPHYYYDENMLHSILISNVKDFDKTIIEIERFLPYVDNWAVCDVISPKIFKNNKEILLKKINEWVNHNHIYTQRFALKMLMTHFLDNDFQSNILEIPANICSDEYYLNMMIAWFYATALAKKWNYTISYLENNLLNTWVHNKTIQKGRESNRISKLQKIYLKSLLIK